MDYKNSPYFHVAHARDLTGRDRVIYRLLEILPGFLSWGTFLAIILCSIFIPVQTAIFIIAFDLYWLLKTIHLSYHHYYNWRRLKHNSQMNWYEMLQNMKFEHLQHLVILPYYKEGIEVVDETIQSLVSSQYKLKKLLIVLAAEQRAGSEAIEIANVMKAKYEKYFGDFIITIHPANLPNEIKGKGPNIAYASEEARKLILDSQGIYCEVDQTPR